jgi:hypothetical protein
MMAMRDGVAGKSICCEKVSDHLVMRHWLPLHRPAKSSARSRTRPSPRGRRTAASRRVVHAKAPEARWEGAGKRQNGCTGASTIHSLTYKAQEGEKTGATKFILRPKFEFQKSALIVVDECSTLEAAASGRSHVNAGPLDDHFEFDLTLRPT